MAERDQQKEFQRWDSEIQNALKDQAYKKWLARCDRIVKRYRDERRDVDGGLGFKRYNILWSNVETLKGAVYGKMPKPIAERRFLDRDPAARLASLILERTLSFQLDVGGFNRAARKAVKDRLLPGMGVMWQRYEPSFEPAKIEEENEQEAEYEEEGESPEQAGQDGFGIVDDKLTFERVCFDYVFYRDFLWSPSRCWDEVPWIAKREWMDKAQAEEAFGKEVADKMQFGEVKNNANLAGPQEPLTLGKSEKAEVWEIWSKPDRYVCFIAPNTPGLLLKQVDDDPLKLEGFYPCQEPLFATQTNDTLVPVPDYVEYQDQASELDVLTDRIAHITTAIKAAGVYNSQFPSLARLLQDGNDLKLVPVDDWAAFAEKGGMPGAMSLIPMQELAEVLSTLQDQRDRVKAGIDELTGIADVIRGISDPNETAAAQKIKSNYASGRLRTRQEEVAEFCAGSVRIAAEIISEIFSPESLLQMSGVDQMNREAIQKAVESTPAPPKPQIPPNSPPMVGQQAQQQWQAQWDAAKRQAAVTKQQELDGQFQQALQILRSDKLRGFRVDIETDSTIADDMQQDKAAAVEFISGMMQSIQGAETTLQAAPELIKPLGQTIMWAARKYRVGRTLESSFEDAFDQIEARIEAMKDQPKQPSPDEMKAQADMQVAQANVAATNAKAQAETARSQADIRVQTIQLQSEQAQAALQTRLDAATLQVDQLKAAAENNTQIQLARMQMLDHITVALVNAKAGNDSAAIDAQLEKVLGFMNMQHEAAQNALDREHEANMSAQQQTHDETMQANAPKPQSQTANA